MTLRITTNENEQSFAMKVEGRIVGPSVAELLSAWSETAPRLGARKLLLDLSDVTYADARGKQVLRRIYLLTQAKFVTSTPWCQFLAEDIAVNQADYAEGAD